VEVLMRVALSNVLSASLLATVVAAVGLFASRRPAVLHYLWLIVLVKLLAPPMLEVPLAIPHARAAAVMAAFAPDELVSTEPDTASTPWVEPATLWGLLGIVWLAGSLATASIAVVRIRRFQELLTIAQPAGPEVHREVSDLSGRLGIRRQPEVGFIDGKLTPMLWAVGRPRLVIPRDLWNGLDERRRTLLLTHELAHLKRGDHWLRLFELAVTIAYWWLPVVWWVRRALRDVEEQCCDAWVVWMFPDEARAYAETLLDTLDFLNPVAKPEPLLASGFGKVHHHRRRLTMVMMGTTPRTLGWSGTLGALALTGLLVPMSPTWAKTVETPTEAVELRTAADQTATLVLPNFDELKANSIPVLLVTDSEDHRKRGDGRRDHASSDKDKKSDHARSRYARWSREKSDHAKGEHGTRDGEKSGHAKGEQGKRDGEKSSHAKGDRAKGDREKSDRKD
jgi:bla regulator protein BlaR1